MAGVAKAVLVSLEKQFGAAPGSLSGLMDVCVEEEDGSGVVPPGSPMPAGSYKITHRASSTANF